MGFNINRVTLLGNATKPAELKYTPNGNAVCNFSMATNHGVKKGDTWEDVPTFHRIVVWGKLAEYANKEIGKGSKVVVEGRIDNRSYKDKDGNDKYISEVVAETVVVFRTGQTAAGNAYQEPQPPSEAEQVFSEGGQPVKSAGEQVADEIPF